VGPTKSLQNNPNEICPTLSCHVSTDMSEIVLVGLNRTISAH
jgi:hypothetical protein